MKVRARSVFSYKCEPLAAEKRSLTVQNSGHIQSKSRGPAGFSSTGRKRHARNLPEIRDKDIRGGSQLRNIGDDLSRAVFCNRA